jgi:hypothetical protein
MNNKKVILFSIIGFFTLTFMFSGCWAINKNIDTDNSEIDLRTAIEAKKKDNEATYDNMWKIINQKAQVAEQYKNAFKDIYVSITDERYDSNSGSLMQWIQEHNPQFDVSLYKSVMESITIERNNFLTRQRQLIDLKREHDNLRLKWPSKWFIDNSVKEINITVVSSTKTKKIMETGVDDDVNLFKK